MNFIKEICNNIGDFLIAFATGLEKPVTTAELLFVTGMVWTSSTIVYLFITAVLIAYVYEKGLGE